MNILKRLFSMLCLLSIMSGCALITSIQDIYNTEVKIQEYSYGDKSLVFIPIVHFGQQAFYTNLKNLVVSKKSNGYTVFYEEIKPKSTNKEDLKPYELKWRQISGGTGKSRADYAQLSEAFEGGVSQPEYKELGVDSTDINADISFEALIDKYEEIYGAVVLSDCDNTTPLDAEYTCGEGLKNDLSPIILNYRNEQLAQQITNTDLKKIIIIYGKDHMSGVQAILRKKQPLVK